MQLGTEIFLFTHHKKKFHKLNTNLIQIAVITVNIIADQFRQKSKGNNSNLLEKNSHFFPLGKKPCHLHNFEKENIQAFSENRNITKN